MGMVAPYRRSRRRWWQALGLWQRIAVLVVLFGALVLGIGLIYAGPVAHIITDTNPAWPVATTTDAPFYPPGTRYYYRRGQWLPFDQQMPAQP